MGTDDDSATPSLTACAALLPEPCRGALEALSSRMGTGVGFPIPSLGTCGALLPESCWNALEEMSGRMESDADATLSVLTARVCGALPALCEKESEPLTKEEKREFGDLMNELDRDAPDREGETPMDRESMTQYAYYVGFIANTTLFAVLFVTIFIAVASEGSGTLKDEESRSPEAPRPPEMQDDPGDAIMLVPLAAALFFATFWMLMRLAFLAEKLTLYPEEPLLTLNYLVFLAIVALYAHLVARLWSRSRSYARQLNVILSVAGVGVGVLGLFGETLSARWMPEVLVDLFGTGSSHLTYIGVLLFLFVVYFPYILRFTGAGGKPGGVGGSGAT